MKKTIYDFFRRFVFLTFAGVGSLYAQNEINHVDLTLIHENDIATDSSGWAAYAILASFDHALSAAGFQAHMHSYSSKNVKKDLLTLDPVLNKAAFASQYAVLITSKIDKNKIEYAIDAVSAGQKKYLLKKSVFKGELPDQIFSLHEKAVSEFVKSTNAVSKETIQKAVQKIQLTKNGSAYRNYMAGKVLRSLTLTDERLQQAGEYFQKAINEDANFYQAYAELAQVHVLKKEYERAFNVYKSYQDKSQTAKDVNSAVGDIYYYHLNDTRKAKSYYEKELALNPNSSAVQVRLGYCAYDDKNYELSKQYANQALKLNALESPALNLLGLSAMGLKDSAKAKEYFMQAARINRYEIPARKNLARLYEIKNNFEDAKTLYLQIVDADPLDAFAMVSYANLNYLQGNVKQAAAYFMQGVIVKPELESMKENPIQIFQFLSKNRKDIKPVQSLADSLNESILEGELNAQEEFLYRSALGYASLYYLNDFAEASNQFQIALKLRPDALRLRFYLAESYYRADKLTQALDYYRIYADDAKDSYNFARCHLMIGKILVKQKKFEDAQLEILKSIRMYPNAESYYQYGLALKGNKQNEEAVSAFEKAVKTFPNYIEVYLEAAKTFEEMKKYDKALQQAQKAVSLDSSSFYARQTLSHVYFSLERWDDAEKEIAEGIRLMNRSQISDAQLYRDYGDILLQQNKTDLALSQYELGWALDSLSDTTPYRIASVYASRNDENGAARWMLKAFHNNFSDFAELERNKLFNQVKNKPIFKEVVRQYEQAYREELLKRIQQKK